MKTYWLWLVLLSILTACGNPAPSPTPTPIPPTAVPTATRAPTATPQPTRAPTPMIAGDGLPGRAAPDEGAKHTDIGTLIPYKNSPPSSGTHFPQWLKYGVYAQPIPPGYWIHNLEHGAVVVLFKCDTNCQDIGAQVLKVYQTMRPSKYGEVKMIGIPYNDMPRNFTVVAWGRVDDFDTLDAERIQNFYEAFVDKGPEDVP
jgi:hypothetical protein